MGNHPNLFHSKVKNYNLNVTDILDSDFKNSFSGIFNCTVGILRRNADSSEVLENLPQKQPDKNVEAALVETAVKIISEESAVSEDELVNGTNRDEDRPRTPDSDIENMDEVLEKTRRAHATFIPENKTENHLKQSLNLANSLDHVAIESTDIDSVRKVISIYI